MWYFKLWNGPFWPLCFYTHCHLYPDTTAKYFFFFFFFFFRAIWWKSSPYMIYQSSYIHHLLSEPICTHTKTPQQLKGENPRYPRPIHEAPGPVSNPLRTHHPVPSHCTPTQSLAWISKKESHNNRNVLDKMHWRHRPRRGKVIGNIQPFVPIDIPETASIYQHHQVDVKERDILISQFLPVAKVVVSGFVGVADIKGLSPALV